MVNSFFSFASLANGFSLVRGGANFDEHLSTHYIITGERGEEYSITLDRNMVVGEE